jgi:hypothetical protein
MVNTQVSSIVNGRTKFSGTLAAFLHLRLQRSEQRPTWVVCKNESQGNQLHGFNVT